MTREEKQVLVNELTEKLKSKPNVYISDTGGLSVAKVNDLRRACFDAGVEMVVVKNTLLRKAMEKTGRNYEGIFPTLHYTSAVFFITENFKAPANIIKDFRKKGGDKPVLKGAFIDDAVFLGDESLDQLISLKSKNELIGEVIGLLQSPMQKVISALQSGGGTIAGVLKTLEERGN